MTYKNLKFKPAGDTIIEVMAAISILGLALGAAYGLSNRSFQTALHTHDRVEALSLAQGQIEFLKDKGLKSTINNLIAKYPNGEKFCFKDNDGTDVPATNDYCVSYGPDNASIYDISISYCDGSGGCAPVDVFTVQATWIAGGSGKQNQLTVYYKAQR